jgi:hypothetical protein
MMASFEGSEIWEKAAELSVRLYDLETAAIIFLEKNCER